MIGSLKGIIDEIFIDNVIIDVNGVGYDVAIPKRQIARLKIGDECKFVIYTHVKEDQFALFGFESALEKKIFLDFLKVSGIGAKTAMSIIGSFDANQIQNAIFSQDAKLFQTISGIGKKASERIITDLKDKYKDLDFAINSDALTISGTNDNASFDNDTKDAISALENLGYNRGNILKIIKKVKSESGSIEELITNSLKELA